MMSGTTHYVPGSIEAETSRSIRQAKKNIQRKRRSVLYFILAGRDMRPVLAKLDPLIFINVRVRYDTAATHIEPLRCAVWADEGQMIGEP